MGDKKKEIEHFGRKLSNGRGVWLGRYDSGYSLIFKRPAEENDRESLPQYVSICDDKVMTKISLSKDVMAAIIDLYINQDYDGVKKTIFIYEKPNGSSE